MVHEVAPQRHAKEVGVRVRSKVGAARGLGRDSWALCGKGRGVTWDRFVPPVGGQADGLARRAKQRTCSARSFVTSYLRLNPEVSQCFF